MEKSIGFVLMLDVSGSMQDAISQVKINANALLAESISGDMFAINSFREVASWVYPSNGNMVTVTTSEILAAQNEIEKLTADGLTNIAHAIQLGNNKIAQASTDTSAFILLSDGWHNTGSQQPENALGSTPPIYVAGMGSCQAINFEKLVSKNEKSLFYYRPHSYEMMYMFNQIRADSADGMCLANAVYNTKGSSYTLDSFYASQRSNVQVCVTWSDKKFVYTPNDANKNQVYVGLIDPSGKRLPLRPEIDGNGFCVFNIVDTQPGEWKVLTEFSTPDPFYTTVGTIDRRLKCLGDVVAPLTSVVGNPVQFRINPHDAARDVNIDVKAIKYEPEKAQANEHSDSSTEFKVVESVSNVKQKLANDNGSSFILEDTANPGIYSVEICASGTNASTGNKFTQKKMLSIVVN